MLATEVNLPRGNAFRSPERRIDALLTTELPTIAGMVNIFLLALFSMNGLWNIVPGGLIDVASHVSIAIFWLSSTAAFIYIRCRIPWHLWTCRFSFIFLCWILISAAWSSQPFSTTYSPMLSTICVFFYYCYVMDRFTPRQFRMLLFKMFTVMFIATVLAVILIPGRGKETLAGSNNEAIVGAWKGLYRQKNELGLNCAIAFALCVGFVPRNSFERVWRAGLLALTLVLTYKSGSREAWVAVAVITCLSPALKIFRRLRQTSRLPALAIAFMLCVFAVAVVYLNLDFFLGLIGRDRTLTGRSNIWDYAMLGAQRHPWIGYGLYGYWRTALANEVVVRAGWEVTSSHNSYLDVVISYGLVGLVLYLPIPLSAIIYSFRAALSYRLEDLEMYIYMLIGIIILSFAGGFLTYAPGICYVLAIYIISNLEKVERSGFMRLDPPTKSVVT